MRRRLNSTESIGCRTQVNIIVSERQLCVTRVIRSCRAFPRGIDMRVSVHARTDSVSVQSYGAGNVVSQSVSKWWYYSAPKVIGSEIMIACPCSNCMASEHEEKIIGVWLTRKRNNAGLHWYETTVLVTMQSYSGVEEICLDFPPEKT